MESEYGTGKGHLAHSGNPNTESESESSPLSIESFSDSWLTSNYQGKSKSTLVIKTQEHSQTNFYFDVAISRSLVDADQIFSNGLIKPVLDRDLYEEYSPPSSPGPPIYSPPSVAHKSGAGVRCRNVGRWKKSPEKVLRRCIGYLRLLLTSKRSWRVDDIDRRSIFEKMT